MGLGRTVFHRVVTLVIRSSARSSFHQEMGVHLPQWAAWNHNLHCILNHRIGVEEGIAGSYHLRSAGIAPESCLDYTLGMSCYGNEMARSGDGLHVVVCRRGLGIDSPEKTRSFLGTPKGEG